MQTWKKIKLDLFGVSNKKSNVFNLDGPSTIIWILQNILKKCGVESLLVIIMTEDALDKVAEIGGELMLLNSWMTALEIGTLT